MAPGDGAVSRRGIPVTSAKGSAVAAGIRHHPVPRTTTRWLSGLRSSRPPLLHVLKEGAVIVQHMPHDHAVNQRDDHVIKGHASSLPCRDERSAPLKQCLMDGGMFPGFRVADGSQHPLLLPEMHTYRINKRQDARPPGVQPVSTAKRAMIESAFASKAL